MSKTLPLAEEETPKSSKIAEKLKKFNPSTLSDEKRAKVVRRIQLGAAYATGVLITIAAVNLKNYYDSFPPVEETEESTETEETTED